MSKYVDAIIGHAIGDAMGVPTEFCTREKLLNHPVTTMIGYGSYSVPAGTWSDDTSMEIATIDSFINKGYFDMKDIMNNFYLWLRESKYTAINRVFDAGHTCTRSIINYSKGCDIDKCGSNDFRSNGNGSLMRILPVALYSYSKNLSDLEIIKLVNDISSLTHGHDISKLGCYIYVKYVIFLLKGLPKEKAYEEIQKVDYSPYEKESIDVYKRILKDNIKEYPMDTISSSGYVVDTLECALWILLNVNSYRDTIIVSTNIGEDTDTIGAVVGGMAGIIYGMDSISKDWLNTLIKKDYLINLALEFEKKVNK